MSLSNLRRSFGFAIIWACCAVAVGCQSFGEGVGEGAVEEAADQVRGETED